MSTAARRPIPHARRPFVDVESMRDGGDSRHDTAQAGHRTQRSRHGDGVAGQRPGLVRQPGARRLPAPPSALPRRPWRADLVRLGVPPSRAAAALRADRRPAASRRGDGRRRHGGPRREVLVARDGQLLPSGPSNRGIERSRPAAATLGRRTRAGVRLRRRAGPRAQGRDVIEPLLRIALVSSLAILAGLPLVAPGRRPAAGDLAAAWTLALGNAAVLALAAGLLGLPRWPAARLVLLIAPGAAAAVLGRGPRREPENGDAAGSRGDPAAGGRGPAGRISPAIDSGALAAASRIALACAVAALVLKLARAPLWSWDHYAIWGVKARSMLAGGHLRLDFLRSLYQTRTDHPLGLPMTWLMLTLGESPSQAVFKVLHALFALALVAVLRDAVRRATSSPALANAAAAFLAVSPLLWDSEAVGLAEVPLALWAMVSLLLLAPPAHAASRYRPWVPGLALGFLPWIKQEGLVLSLLLLAAALLPMQPMLPMPRARRGGPSAAAAVALLCGPALALMAGALAIQKLVLPPGSSFLLGDWWRRGLDRLPLFMDIQRRCLSLLVQPDWLGFWIVLAALTVVALARRHGMALAVIAIVWIEVLVYELTAVVTYLPPLAHLEASFFRICGALVPIGLLGMAMLSRKVAGGGGGPPANGDPIGEGRSQAAIRTAPRPRRGAAGRPSSDWTSPRRPAAE